MATETRSDLPASRAEAKRLGYRHYFTGKPCKHGHVDVRMINGDCAECARQRSRNCRHRNPELIRQRCRDWHHRNRKRVQEYHRQRRKLNPEHVKAIDKRSREKNKEKQNAYTRDWFCRNPNYTKQWRGANPEKARLYVRTRQAARKNAVPGWLTPADRAKMEQVYRVADGLGRRYNEPHEVDHVVPLQSDRVCGLHCPANLQVLPAAQNASKGNRWDPDVGTANT